MLVELGLAVCKIDVFVGARTVVRKALEPRFHTIEHCVCGGHGGEGHAHPAQAVSPREELSRGKGGFSLALSHGRFYYHDARLIQLPGCTSGRHLNRPRFSTLRKCEPLSKELIKGQNVWARL